MAAFRKLDSGRSECNRHRRTPISVAIFASDGQRLAAQLTHARHQGAAGELDGDGKDDLMFHSETGDVADRAALDASTQPECVFA